MTAFGYVRSATGNIEQLEEQKAAILEFFRSKSMEPGPIFVEEPGSGLLPPTDHPVFADLIKRLIPGDTLVVTRADRICRDPRLLIEAVQDLALRGVKVQLVMNDILDME